MAKAKQEKPEGIEERLLKLEGAVRALEGNGRLQLLATSTLPAVRFVSLTSTPAGGGSAATVPLADPLNYPTSNNPTFTFTIASRVPSGYVLAVWLLDLDGNNDQKLSAVAGTQNYAVNTTQLGNVALKHFLLQASIVWPTDDADVLTSCAIGINTT